MNTRYFFRDRARPLWLGFAMVSMLLHVGGMALLDNRVGHQEKPLPPVQLRVVDVPPPPPPPLPPAAEEPKPKPKPKPKKAIPPPNQPPLPTKVQPVQGVTKESVTDGASTFAAPIGNTLHAADEGVRNADAAPYQGDLSAEPKLISFTKPEYTDEALDAGLEGRFTIDLFIDATGKVTEANLQQKVGSGMDDLLVKAALAARFEPRKNAQGVAIPGWHEIKVRLSIP